MKFLEWARRRVLGTALVCFGAGAGTAVLILGVPRLWSAEAAGWASALGTFAAAGVALWIALRAIQSERAMRSHRCAIARTRAMVVGTRVFDEVEMVGNGPGICADYWDSYSVEFLLVCGRRLRAACEEVNAILFDLDESTSLVFADIAASGVAIANQISELERHSETMRIQLAQHITTGIHERAHRLLAEEGETMRTVGIELTPVRMRVERTPGKGS